VYTYSVEIRIGSLGEKSFPNAIPQKATGVFTVLIGGAAGDGVRETGASLAQLLADLGFEVFMSFKYPTLIRGGHNYARVSFSREKVWNDHVELDLLIALNKETVRLHTGELKPDALILAESLSAEDEAALGSRAVRLPMADMSKQAQAPAIMRNSVALGACCYVLDLPMEKMNTILGTVFRGKGAQANIALADLGFTFASNAGLRHANMLATTGAGAEISDGNTAFARGLVAAGLNLYLAYPMTPSTSILTYFARTGRGAGVKVFQSENELAVINMALGAAYAGARVAVGTASGGFALMQEAMSHAGMAELPVVIAVSQRQGPATGVPTHSSQADLRFILHAGHGEFLKLVVAPGDPEEAFQCAAQSLALAWKYQTPALVVLDKHVSENMMTCRLNSAVAPRKAQAKAYDPAVGAYARYAAAPDGVSPLTFPGTPGADVKATSYEHDESGIAIEDAALVQAMQEKRFAKREALLRELGDYDTVKTYGDPAAETALVFWGSAKTAVLEAAKYIAKPVRLVQVLWLEPFDAEKVQLALRGARRIVNVENNRTGQLASLIRERTGLAATDSIVRYDSKPFTPLELAGAVNSLIA